MVSEGTTRNMVWGFAITLAVIGILLLLGGLMAIPAVGIDQGVIIFMVLGLGAIWLAKKVITGLRLSKKHGISLTSPPTS